MDTFTGFQLKDLITLAIYLITLAVGWGKLSATMRHLEDGQKSLVAQLEAQTLKISLLQSKEGCQEMRQLNDTAELATATTLNARLDRIEHRLDVLIEKLSK